MKYNFDKEVCRKGSNCSKWDSVSNDVIPLWIADMDFEVPKEVRENIEKRLQHEVFGYTFIGDSYYDAVTSWMKEIHDWDIKREWIKFVPGVVPGLSFLIAALTNPGDEIIVQTPVYHQFFNVIRNNGCKVIENQLINNNGYYTMDYEDLEAKINHSTKMIILCSPHNPVGRVWTKEELRKVSDIALRNNVLVVCDEIHSDIVFGHNKHNVFSTISKEAEENCVICTAPNKTFNIAGLKTANFIIPNKDIRDKFDIYLEKVHITAPTIFGAIAQESVYNYGQEWYRELIKYLNDNIEFVVDFINTRIPKLKVVKPEGTYLLWVDFSAIKMDSEERNNRLINEAGLVFNKGSVFGKCGENYERINIATQRDILKDAMNRLEKFINKL